MTPFPNGVPAGVDQAHRPGPPPERADAPGLKHAPGETL